MLACPQSGASDSALDRDAAEAANRNPKELPDRCRKHVLPLAVRQVAREASKEHGIALSEFLSKAILFYAQQLTAPANAAEEDIPASPDALRFLEHRIVMLERRVAAVEKARAEEQVAVRGFLPNLVNRPWLRSQDT